MRRIAGLAWLIVTLMLAGGSAHAYVDQPVLTPQPLIANQPIQIRVVWGGWHVLPEHPDPTLFPRVIRSGQSIRIEMFGWDTSYTFPATYFEPQEWTHPIGQFPGGNYTVQFVLASPVPDGFEYTTVHTFPIRIEGAGDPTPVSLPLGGSVWLSLLISALAIAGGLVMRRGAGRAA